MQRGENAVFPVLSVLHDAGVRIGARIPRRNVRQVNGDSGQCRNAIIGDEENGMQNIFIAISAAGLHRDLSEGSREQPVWDEYAAFIDELVDEGFILLGDPSVDGGGRCSS
jgi:hypothetical protein